MAFRMTWSLLALFISLTCATPLSRSSNTARALLDRALAALGGEDAIENLIGVTYHAPSFVSITGYQNISFGFSSDEIEQRIDRHFIPSSYWYWDSPGLDPFDFSLVVRGGDDGFACYVHGNNQIWLPSNFTSGYTDSALAEYLVLHAEILSPKLLTKIKQHNDISETTIDVNGLQMQAVYDPILNLSVIFDPSSNLPYIVRTIEDHYIYGPSTNDLYLTNYTAVDGIHFPHHIQTVYNSSQNLDAPLEDYVVEEVIPNPDFPSGFFNGLPEDQSMPPKVAPKKVEGISHARITEFSSNMLWGGITNATVGGLKVEQPVPGLSSVHWLILDDEFLGVKQFVIEFENEIIVGDAPPQWTSVVIEWIAQNLKKPITHLWPTHHHRDHSGGAAEYVALGAKLIVPEMAVKYWSSIPNATFVTFNDTHPYIHTDVATQAWFLWQPEALHAADWSYAFVTEKCPAGTKSSVAVLEADAWEAGLPLGQSDQALMRQWLDQVKSDGLSRDAVVLPTHGQVSPLTDLVSITGYPYPELGVGHWRGGAAMC